MEMIRLLIDIINNGITKIDEKKKAHFSLKLFNVFLYFKKIVIRKNNINPLIKVMKIEDAKYIIRDSPFGILDIYCVTFAKDDW